MDAVYLLGPNRQDGEPLRYSLRSLVNLPQVGRVVTVGYRWPWLDTVHIDVPTRRMKHESTYANLCAALTSGLVSDEFVLMNDDFFIIEPVPQLPVLHRGPMDHHIANHERTRNHTMHTRGLQVRRMLADLGITDPLCYELHVPMPVDKHAMWQALVLAETVRPQGMPPTGKRTLYGNITGIGGTETHDVKVGLRSEDLPPGPLASTRPASWMGRAGQQIRSRFSHPCRWEVQS